MDWKRVVCSVDGCDGLTKALGLCSKHWMRQRVHGDPNVVHTGRSGQANCNEEGCKRTHYAKGFCRLHYKRKAAGISVTTCEWCGKENSQAGAKYCSSSCRMKWHRQFGCYTDARILKSRGECSIEKCEKPVRAQGLCSAHVSKKRAYGDPLTVKRGPRIENCVKCGAKRSKSGTAKDLCHRCYHNSYYHENTETERPRRNARRSYLKKVTPPWADLEKIREIYEKCPPGHQVDHQIPIRGKRVSGLHVETNLQYLSTLDNRRKSNKYAPST